MVLVGDRRMVHPCLKGSAFEIFIFKEIRGALNVTS